MFDPKQSAALRKTLEPFSFAAPCDPATVVAGPLAEYLEYYGHVALLKDIPSDYFLGFVPCQFGDENLRVATHVWQVPNPRGVVVMVHGLYDHVGLYLKLVRHCLAQGYHVCACDLPGHGLSDGAPTEVAQFDDYAHVVAELFDQFASHWQSLPAYAVGQSTGAAVLMALAFAEAQAQRSPRFQRLVLLAPLVQPKRWGMGRLAFRLLGRWLKRLPRDFSMSNSHDNEFCLFQRYQDPLQAKHLSIRWVAALDQWVSGFSQRPVVDTPILIIQGTADHTVDWPTNIPLIKQRFRCHQVSFIEGAMHHLVNEAEPWRQAILGGVSGFLQQRVVGVEQDKNRAP